MLATLKGGKAPLSLSAVGDLGITFDLHEKQKAFYGKPRDATHCMNLLHASVQKNWGEVKANQC